MTALVMLGTLEVLGDEFWQVSPHASTLHNSTELTLCQKQMVHMEGGKKMPLMNFDALNKQLYDQLPPSCS